MFELKMNREEAILLQRAAIAGLKGSRPVHQDKMTAEAVLGKLYSLADQIILQSGKTC